MTGLSRRVASVSAVALAVTLAAAITRPSFAVTGNPVPEWQPPAAAQQAPSRQVLYSDINVRPAEAPVIVPGSPFSDPHVRDPARPLTKDDIGRYIETLSWRAQSGY
jgi:hypothetical protein